VYALLMCTHLNCAVYMLKSRCVHTIVAAAAAGAEADQEEAQLDDRAGVELIKRRELDDELAWSWSWNMNG